MGLMQMCGFRGACPSCPQSCVINKKLIQKLTPHAARLNGRMADTAMAMAICPQIGALGMFFTAMTDEAYEAAKDAKDSPSRNAGASNASSQRRTPGSAGPTTGARGLLQADAAAARALLEDEPAPALAIDGQYEATKVSGDMACPTDAVTIDRISTLLRGDARSGKKAEHGIFMSSVALRKFIADQCTTMAVADMSNMDKALLRDLAAGRPWTSPQLRSGDVVVDQAAESSGIYQMPPIPDPTSLCSAKAMPVKAAMSILECVTNKCDMPMLTRSSCSNGLEAVLGFSVAAGAEYMAANKAINDRCNIATDKASCEATTDSQLVTRAQAAAGALSPARGARAVAVGLDVRGGSPQGPADRDKLAAILATKLGVAPSAVVVQGFAHAVTTTISLEGVNTAELTAGGARVAALECAVGGVTGAGCNGVEVVTGSSVGRKLLTIDVLVTINTPSDVRATVAVEAFASPSAALALTGALQAAGAGEAVSASAVQHAVVETFVDLDVNAASAAEYDALVSRTNAGVKLTPEEMTAGGLEVGTVATPVLNADSGSAHMPKGMCRFGAAFLTVAALATML